MNGQNSNDGDSLYAVLNEILHGLCPSLSMRRGDRCDDGRVSENSLNSDTGCLKSLTRAGNGRLSSTKPLDVQPKTVGVKLYGAGLLDMHIAMRVRRLNFRFADLCGRVWNFPKAKDLWPSHSAPRRRRVKRRPSSGSTPWAKP